MMMYAKIRFGKDGNKNRMREQDVSKIVGVWHSRTDEEKFARIVTM